MLSIRAISGTGLGDYYLHLAREDYYLKGGEPPGHWLGSGARALGLRGEVGKEQLRAVLFGISPHNGKPLCQNAGNKKRHSGWDLTFSAPKSVSVLWALGDREQRAAIQDAHAHAVRKVIDILEREQVFTRRDKGGVRLERARIVCAAFEHGTSRALDPQLHTHVVLSNVGERADGTWGTIVGRSLFENKMALGALYRAELTHNLGARFAVTWKRTGNLVEEASVPEELLEMFAKRRREIEEVLEKRGLKSARASEIAALDSRSVKELVPREELLSRWGEEALKGGFSLKALQSRSKAKDGDRESEVDAGKLIGKLLEHQSYFRDWELIRRWAEAGQGAGYSAERVISEARKYLRTEKEVQFLGDQGFQSVFTTEGTLQLERELLELFGENKEKRVIGKGDLEGAVKREGFSEEQTKALNLIGEGRQLSIVSGLAGTGKSSLLRVGGRLLAERGYELLGVAPSGKAADGLQNAAGIESCTIHMLLNRMQKGEVLASETTVLIVDEAGMVGTRLLKDACEWAVKGGGRVILVGDERQLQPIAAGGPFRGLLKRFGGALLSTIKRQRRAWDVERILEFIDGNAERAFKAYAKEGKLRVGESAEEAKELAVNAWAEKGGLRDPERNLMLACENAEVISLNKKAQQLRKVNALLGSISLEANGQKFFAGDRVVFTKNSKGLGVRNGSFGTVKEVHRRYQRLHVMLDSGKLVKVKLSSFPHIRLGYAVTTHKAQGVTAENVFAVMGSGLQDREASYVQASRARGDTYFFVGAEDAGENLKRISHIASISHPKFLAHEMRTLCNQ